MKPNYVYAIDTRIRGVIYTDDEKVAKECDPGELCDIDIMRPDNGAESGFILAEGTYSFVVVAKNEPEALEKAEEIFSDFWDDGIDFGDIEDTEQADYTDGNQETYRISECLGLFDELVKRDNEE